MASADILRAARARIEDPKNWAQGWYAFNVYGHEVLAIEDDAICWCALGALHIAGSLDSSSEAILLDAIAQEKFGLFIADVNDNGTHDEVMSVYDAAIAAAEAEAGR